MAKLLKSLDEDEFLLIRDTKKTRMADLDEDDLIALHGRIRKARNKYVKLYRRAGAAKVVGKGARGAGKDANTRNARKAELFEDALARVSRRLAVVAEQTALELKQERLAAARTDAPSFDGAGAGTGKVHTDGAMRVDRTRESPGRKKYEASTIAAGDRRQAARDNR
ncbi:hypothetical protein ACFWPA_02680 [Rhodococcus sp. NPDC058505]|uniref:hypothetical protein n=1 Tax=unclassified Rhodococcus (in: high G+C Gram-positive bacteria) TaxID=192944 RepID=UPI0036530A53